MAERPRRHRCPWTAQESARLRDLLEEGYVAREIAAALGRTPEAVEQKRYRLGLEFSRDNWLAVAEAARQLGVTQRTMARFVANGWLPIRRTRRRGRPVVDPEDILDFLADSSHWHEYEPRGIADPEWRAWACEVRGELVFLTVKQVASVLALTEAAVRWRIRHGWIKAVRSLSGTWFVRSDWLNGGTCRPPSGFCRRPFTPDEDSFLRLWRPHQPICYLARALDRAPGVVRARCLTLGLHGPVVPPSDRAHPIRQLLPRMVI